LSPTLSPTPTPSSTPLPTATIQPGANRFEDNSSAVAYSTTSAWTQVLDAGSSAGHFRRATVTGSSATFSLTTSGGAQVTWGAVRGPAAGNADVALDGIFIETVSLSAPVLSYGPAATYQIPSGHHSLRITVRGDHHPASTGVEVNVDYFDVATPIGGRGLTIERLPSSGSLSGIRTTWSTGSAQTGYLLLRLSASGNVVLPPTGTPLSSSATSYTDSGVLGDPMYCYVVFPLLGTPPVGVGISDVLCSLSGLRSNSSPNGFMLTLDDSTVATLSWSPPPFALGSDYVVVAFGDWGLRTITVGVGVVSATDDTAGRVTCYAVLAFLDGQYVGTTDALCGLPGLSTL
jgi:hypothetical protein